MGGCGDIGGCLAKVLGVVLTSLVKKLCGMLEV